MFIYVCISDSFELLEERYLWFLRFDNVRKRIKEFEDDIENFLLNDKVYYKIFKKNYTIETKSLKLEDIQT